MRRNQMPDVQAIADQLVELTDNTGLSLCGTERGIELSDGDGAVAYLVWDDGDYLITADV